MTYIAPSVIERIAERTISNFAPERGELDEVDLNSIASAIGCDIELVTFDPEDISAQVVKDTGNNRYKIQVSREDGKKRQRFSIAHEIAHIILHDTSKDGSLFIERRQPLVDYNADDLYKEVQANMLAAAILMPKRAVIELWDNSHSVDAIADAFNVSNGAVYNRLDNLGLMSGNE